MTTTYVGHEYHLPCPVLWKHKMVDLSWRATKHGCKNSRDNFCVGKIALSIRGSSVSNRTTQSILPAVSLTSWRFYVCNKKNNNINLMNLHKMSHLSGYKLVLTVNMSCKKRSLIGRIQSSLFQVSLIVHVPNWQGRNPPPKAQFK